MKNILFVLILAATQAHASVASASHGHHGATLGSTARSASTSVAANTSTQGTNGRYSLVDDFQPWPEVEMRQFEKPKFVPFDGK